MNKPGALFLVIMTVIEAIILPLFLLFVICPLAAIQGLGVIDINLGEILVFLIFGLCILLPIFFITTILFVIALIYTLVSNKKHQRINN